MTTYYVRKSQTRPKEQGPPVSGRFYFFDASVSGPTDPNGVWTNDANAFDGSLTTVASCETNGTTSNNYLEAAGTNAPATGPSILAVYAAVYVGAGNVNTTLTVSVITTTSETNGIGFSGEEQEEGWYVNTSTQVTAPTGGWTWSELQNLTTKIYFTLPVMTEIAAVGVRVVTADTGTTTTEPYLNPEEVLQDSPSPGDTTYIGSGYYGPTTMNLSQAGTSGSPIKWIGDVDGSFTGDPGLVVLAASSTPSGSEWTSYVLFLNKQSFNEFHNINFAGGSTACVYDAAAGNWNGEGVVFDGCSFENGPDATDYAINVDFNVATTPVTSGITIRNCLVRGGMRFTWDGNSSAEVDMKMTIENCIGISPVATSSYSFFYWDMSGVSTYGVGGVTIRNCTVFGAYSIYVENGTSTTYPIHVRNCYLEGALNKLTTNDGALTSDYNIHRVAPTNVVAGEHDIVMGSVALFGGISDRALERTLGWSPFRPFVPISLNQDFGDFASGVIGAGLTSDAPSVDFYGNQRPSGRRGFKVDLYQFTGHAGITDPGAVWTDASVLASLSHPTSKSTYAYSTTAGTVSLGSESNHLIISGTNAPTTGGEILAVRFLVVVFSPNNVAASATYSLRDSLGNQITTGTSNPTSATNRIYSSVGLNTTTFTWPSASLARSLSWQQLHDLELWIAKSDVDSDPLGLYGVWLQVYSVDEGPTTDIGAVSSAARMHPETTVKRTGTTAGRFEGIGFHRFLVPVTSTSTTVSVYARKDANYTGTAPQLKVSRIPGVTDQTDTHTAAADTWEELSVTFTPTAAGIAIVELISNDTSTTGKCFFDDMVVT